MASKIAALALLALQGAFASPLPQGPNTIAQYNPNVRTMASNATWMVIPFDSATLAQIVAPKKLVPIANDTTKFPNGWPADKHPLLVSFGYDSYIEQLGLEIPQFLMNGALQIPCVDQLGDGKTCFSSYVSIYVGGANGQVLTPDVPAAVASLEGTTTYPGVFLPDNAAISDIGGGQYAAQVDHLIVPNPVSGPSLAPSVFQMIYSKSQSSLLTAKGFHSFISQPNILNNGLCADTPYYFNQTFTRPYFCQGSTTLYNYPEDTNPLPSSLAGTYNGYCYSGTSETVGYNPQTCADAAASADPKAQQ